MKLDLKKSPSMLFSRSLVHLKYIQHIQKDIAKVDGVRKHNTKIGFLNQSYILHLVARWEVFIEELVDYGVNKLGARDGVTHLSTVAANYVANSLKYFRSPKTKNIDSLFQDTLGITKITGSWDCKGLTRNKAANTLSQLITARNEIAHTGTTSKKLTYESNFKRMETLVLMSKSMEARLVKELKLK